MANSGIDCLLLDIVPTSLTPQEEQAGLLMTDPKVRNRLAAGALQRLGKTSPAPLYSEAFASRITPGNLEDDLAKLSQADWIIEAVTENLQVKKKFIQPHRKRMEPGIIVSSNTSGISINEMAEDCSEEFRRHFMGAHFFNPPRYMKLLEVVPGEKTAQELVTFMQEFGSRTLGKGVVIAKDTPNFIANRIGTYGLMVTLREMLEKGYTVEEVDAVTGPAMGRPKSATFRTLDLVGLDTFVHVARNVYDHLKDGQEKAVFFEMPAVLNEMVAQGWTGEKMGQGFYKKVKGAEGSVIEALNLNSKEYAPARKVSSASLEAAKAAKGAAPRLKALLSTPDKYSSLAWDVLKHVLIYSAEKLGEIADTIVDIDNAMKWGFNWDLGPFETWDAIGLSRSVKRMEEEGLTVPVWVKEWIEQGNESFYQRREGETLYYLRSEYASLDAPAERISLQALKQRGKVIRSNTGASLVEIGDGVACLEFHSPNNAIGADILSMISQSVDEAEANYKGLVIANEGKKLLRRREPDAAADGSAGRRVG